MFEHVPEPLQEEARKGAEWLEWWNGLDDGITRSSHRPVLAAKSDTRPSQVSAHGDECPRRARRVLSA